MLSEVHSTEQEFGKYWLSGLTLSKTRFSVAMLMQESRGQVTEHQKSMQWSLDLTLQATVGWGHGVAVQDKIQSSEAAE